LGSRGSLSGVQPKLLAVRDGRKFRPAHRDESSAYIAKLPSGALLDIVENEFLTTRAAGALLPEDTVVDAVIAPLDGIHDRALVVRRFDRLPSGARIHFEEFNQLLDRRSGDDKYDAAYEDMASFILTTPGCAPADAFRLYRRILVCFLTGNTDAHLKNFAMFHAQGGLELTPAYDLVAAALYPEYRTLALSVAGAQNLKISDLKPKHIAALGEACGLSAAIIRDIVGNLDRRRKAAERAVRAAAGKADIAGLGQNLLDLMERRWNGSFSSIGRYLSTKQSGAGTE
jgi:serine/threonine-protein kinase HipA